MVVMKDLLRKLGLNKYESEAYIALIKLGSASAFQISKVSSVPFGRIYDSLNVLEMKGLVEVVPSKPKKYKVVNPKTGLYGLVDEQLNELSIIRDQVRSAVKQIGKKDISDLVTINTGKVNFAKRVAEHFNYEHEYWATSDDFKIEDWYPSIKRRYSAKGREASSRYILVNNNKADPERLKAVKKAGVNIKHYTLPGIRILVSDEELVTISIQDPTHEWVNIHAHNKTLGKALTKLLRTAYNKGKKV